MKNIFCTKGFLIASICFVLINANADSKSKKTGNDLYQEYLYQCSVKKNGDACYTIGNYFYVDPHPSLEEKKDGIIFLDMGCRFDNIDACRAAGMSTLLGEYLQEKDPAKGIEYLKKACDFNDRESCYFFALGGYLNDLLDVNTVKKYMAKSCKLGYKTACDELK